MTYKILFDKKIEKKLKKINKTTEKRILDYLEHKVSKNPYNYGKNLSKDMSKYWRYRVGNYRIICKIKNKELIVLVLDLDHRSTIYKKF